MSDNSRIELLEARLDIADVVYRYAQVVRNGNYDNCADLFSEEATFEIRLATPGSPGSAVSRNKCVGRAAIVAQLQEAAAGSGGMMPMIGNLIVEVHGRNAVCNSIMTATIGTGGQTVTGEYHDTLRHDDKWRFTSRICTIYRAAAK